MTMRLIPAILSTALLLAPDPASASTCGKTDSVLQQLAEGFSEAPAFEGKVNDKPVIVTVSPSGSFTMLAAPAPGVLCMLFAGEGWAAASAPKPVVPDALPQIYRLPDGKGGYRYFYPAAAR